MIRRRRQAEDMSADEVEQFFGSLPMVVRELRHGKRINRFLVLFTIAAFCLVSWRTEVQQDDIRDAALRDRESSFAQCQVTNDNARALNRFLDQVIAAVKSSPDLTKSERAYRIETYESIKQRLPVCKDPT